MNMYDVMYEAICDQYEHGEITLEEAEMLNDTAYDKYIVETSKTSKIKHDEVIAKKHGINLKDHSHENYKKLADAKHKERAGEYKSDEFAYDYVYKNHNPHRKPSIDSGTFVYGPDRDKLLNNERFRPKSKKTRDLAKLTMNPITDRNESLEREISKGKSSMDEVDENDKNLQRYRRMMNRTDAELDKGQHHKNFDDMYLDKAKKLIRADRHTKFVPDGDREGIKFRQAEQYYSGKQANTDWDENNKDRKYVKNRLKNLKTGEKRFSDNKTAVSVNKSVSLENLKARYPKAIRLRKERNSTDLRPGDAYARKLHGNKPNPINKDSNETALYDYFTKKDSLYKGVSDLQKTSKGTKINRSK